MLPSSVAANFPDRCPLSPHAWLITAIFVPYITLMVGLGYYIWKTGQPRRDIGKPGGDEEDERGHDSGPALLRAA